MPDDATKRQLLHIHADYQFWTTVQGVDSPEAAEAFARLEAACRAARVELASVSNEKKIDATIHKSSVDIVGGGKVSVHGNDHHVLLTVTSYEDSAALLLDRSEVEKVADNLNSWLRASRGDDGPV